MNYVPSSIYKILPSLIDAYIPDPPIPSALPIELISLNKHFVIVIVITDYSLFIIRIAFPPVPVIVILSKMQFKNTDCESLLFN
jgi:hypothetical protein